MRSLAILVIGTGIGIGFSVAAVAQGVDPKELLHPPPDSWLTYHGDYSGRRHSGLTEITPENVGQLKQVWRFQTGQNPSIKATPILANGILYVTTPDNLWAIDARTAKEIWHYTHPRNNAFHIGHRGAAIYKDTVYLTTPDCHLIALNAKDGKIKWDILIADSSKGYWSSNAPLIVGNHVLVGVSGDFDNLPGQLKSIDADTGKTQWIFYTTPPPGGTEPESGGATGGQMWMTGTYDPILNLVYVGSGNPTPVLNGRSGRAIIRGRAVSSRSIPTAGNSFGASRSHRMTPTIGMPRKFRCWWMPISMASRASC